MTSDTLYSEVWQQASISDTGADTSTITYLHISKIETTKFRGMFTVFVEVIFLVKSAK